MPKKQKQKQKQKQSQKTSVVVNVGTTKKPASRRPRSVPIPPPQKNPQSISVTLQGSSMNLPAPRTNDYNTILQQLDLIRRQQSQAGSLISNMGRNDLLNRVQATNPFTSRSTNTQSAMLDPYEGEMEEIVEANTTQNSFDNNTYNGKMPIDQDFIIQPILDKDVMREARLKRFEQNIATPTAIQPILDKDVMREARLKRFDQNIVTPSVSVAPTASTASVAPTALSASMPSVSSMSMSSNQDFIRNARMKYFAPSLSSYTSKLGVVEDIETISDISAYDDEDLEDRLTSSVANETNSRYSAKPPSVILDRDAMREARLKRFDQNIVTSKPSVIIPDQDFIRQQRLKRFGQNLGSFTNKIAVVEDVETIKDVIDYDDENLEDRLAEIVEKKEKEDALVEKVKMMSEDEYARKLRDDEKEELRKFGEELTEQQMKKQLEKLVLDKNYERFLKKGKEEEKYLTRRINVPEPKLDEPILMPSELSKKPSEAKATASDIGASTSTNKPKKKTPLTEEEKKERQKEYQRQYYYRKKKEREQFKL